MSQTTITERTELAQELAPLVKSLLAKESKNVADVELVESTDGVSTLPAIYSAGGIKKVVRVATSTLVQETADKADTAVNTTIAKCVEQTAACKTQTDSAAEAEAARKDAEASRVEVETSRVEAEEARQTASATAVKNAEAATAACESYNEHPTKIGDNGNWWAWNVTEQAYYDTGVIAKGGALYPTFAHEGNKLYLVDCPAQLEDKFAKQGNKLTFSIVS